MLKLYCIIFGTICIVIETNALQCWRCSSDVGGNRCSDPFNPDQINQQQKRWMYPECNLPLNVNNARPVCKKMIQMVNGKEVIVRSCSYEQIGGSSGCSSNGTSYITNIFCETCSTDGCNGHSRRTTVQQTANTTVTPSISNKGLQKVLVTDKEFPSEGLDLLRRHFDVIIPQNTLSREELLRLSRNVDGIVWATQERLTGDLLNSRLKAISVFSDNMNHVDLVIQQSNISLAYTPEVSYSAVADLAVGLMIAAGRKFHAGRLNMDTSQARQYSESSLIGLDIERSTVGIIGFTSLSQKIAKRLHGFDVEQILFTTQTGGHEVPLHQNERFVSLNDLVTQSDFVIVTISLDDSTRGLVNTNLLRKMKPTSVLVNIASGEIVNTNDLVNALRNGMIFAAGIDAEPLPVNHPLLSLPNCVITPHLRSSTFFSRREMASIAAQHLIRALKPYY